MRTETPMLNVQVAIHPDHAEVRARDLAKDVAEVVGNALK